VLTKEEILKRLREHKGELQQKFPVKDIALFGSYARGEQTPESDIDLMVEFNSPVGIEFIDLVIYLENFFKKRVDLVTKKSLKKILQPYIEKDLIYV
jgi:uncharacterized protein